MSHEEVGSAELACASVYNHCFLTLVSAAEVGIAVTNRKNVRIDKILEKFALSGSTQEEEANMMVDDVHGQMRKTYTSRAAPEPRATATARSFHPVLFVALNSSGGLVTKSEG